METPLENPGYAPVNVHNLHFKYFVIMVDVDVLYLAVGIWQQRCLYTNNSTSCVLCAMYLDLFSPVGFILCEITAIYIHAQLQHTLVQLVYLEWLSLHIAAKQTLYIRSLFHTLFLKDDHSNFCHGVHAI